MTSKGSIAVDSIHGFDRFRKAGGGLKAAQRFAGRDEMSVGNMDKFHSLTLSLRSPLGPPHRAAAKSFDQVHLDAVGTRRALRRVLR